MGRDWFWFRVSSVKKTRNSATPTNATLACAKSVLWPQTLIATVSIRSYGWSLLIPAQIPPSSYRLIMVFTPNLFSSVIRLITHVFFIGSIDLIRLVTAGALASSSIIRLLILLIKFGLNYWVWEHGFGRKHQGIWHVLWLFTPGFIIRADTFSSSSSSSRIPCKLINFAWVVKLSLPCILRQNVGAENALIFFLVMSYMWGLEVKEQGFSLFL